MLSTIILKPLILKSLTAKSSDFDGVLATSPYNYSRIFNTSKVPSLNEASQRYCKTRLERLTFKIISIKVSLIAPQFFFLKLPDLQSNAGNEKTFPIIIISIAFPKVFFLLGSTTH